MKQERLEREIAELMDEMDALDEFDNRYYEMGLELDDLQAELYEVQGML